MSERAGAAASGPERSGGKASPQSAARASEPLGGARITLISRAQCHLCYVAKEAVARVAAAAGVSWREVDVDADPDLQAEYWDRVPVVLLDGREHGYWRVEEERLLRDLGREPGAPAWPAG